mgnify:CR=1 FL=1
MLSQAWYWTQRLEPERDGWFYKSWQEWQAETSLGRRQQDFPIRTGFVHRDQPRHPPDAAQVADVMRGIGLPQGGDGGFIGGDALGFGHN